MVAQSETNLRGLRNAGDNWQIGLVPARATYHRLPRLAILHRASRLQIGRQSVPFLQPPCSQNHRLPLHHTISTPIFEPKPCFFSDCGTKLRRSTYAFWCRPARMGHGRTALPVRDTSDQQSLLRAKPRRATAQWSAWAEAHPTASCWGRLETGGHSTAASTLHASHFALICPSTLLRVPVAGCQLTVDGSRLPGYASTPPARRRPRIYASTLLRIYPSTLLRATGHESRVTASLVAEPRGAVGDVDL